MEEQLLNLHYNQSKFSPDRYMMMLNRDQDRERGLPLREKSTHRNGANSHVPSCLVCFREPPPPRPYSSFESRHPGFFFRMPGKVPHLYTKIIISISSGLVSL